MSKFVKIIFTAIATTAICLGFAIGFLSMFVKDPPEFRSLGIKSCMWNGQGMQAELLFNYNKHFKQTDYILRIPGGSESLLQELKFNAIIAVVELSDGNKSEYYTINIPTDTTDCCITDTAA